MRRWQRCPADGREEGDEVLTVQELSKIYWLNKEIDMWQKELERLENQSMAKTLDLSELPQHGNRAKSKVENQVLHPEMLREEILALKERAEQELSTLRRYIKEIDDSLVRQIIEYKYAQRLSWEDTAAKIGGANTKESLRKILQRFLKKGK